MATELLAAALTEADSGTVTLTEGARATLFLTGAALQASTTIAGYIAIQLQAASGAWNNVFLLDNNQRTARIEGPATFRVRRLAREERLLALGVDRA